jgi:hypothetical protein
MAMKLAPIFSSLLALRHSAGRGIGATVHNKRPTVGNFWVIVNHNGNVIFDHIERGVYANDAPEELGPLRPGPIPPKIPMIFMWR